MSYRCYCDKCHKEIQFRYLCKETPYTFVFRAESPLMEERYEICKDCYKKFKAFFKGDSQ